MADPVNVAATGGENPLATILTETADIQTLASRLGHLALAIDHMGEDLCGRTADRHDANVVRGIIAFAEIAREMAGQIGDAGERVEMAANQARRA